MINRESTVSNPSFQQPADANSAVLQNYIETQMTSTALLQTSHNTVENNRVRPMKQILDKWRRQHETLLASDPSHHPAGLQHLQNAAPYWHICERILDDPQVVTLLNQCDVGAERAEMAEIFLGGDGL